MRARLLDLGEVGPVRSQSAYHAVLAQIRAEDDPVVLLVRPAGPLVSVGDAGSDVVDLSTCLADGVPLVRRLISGPTEILDENDLLIQLVLPAGCEPAALAPTAAQPMLEMLADLGINAASHPDGGLETPAGRLGRVQAAAVDASVCVAYSLTWSGPSGRPGGSTSSVMAQMEEPVSLADLAELSLSALERRFSLDLVPSMPTPGELEAIYHWDSRLLMEAIDDPPLPRAVAATVH